MARRAIFPRITIHTDYYYRKFLTKTCTTGYCFSLAITLIVLFLPFLTTYSTGRRCLIVLLRLISSHACMPSVLHLVLFVFDVQNSGRNKPSLRKNQKSDSVTKYTQSCFSLTTQTRRCTRMSIRR